MNTFLISKAVPDVDDLLLMPVEAVARLVLNDLKVRHLQSQRERLPYVSLLHYINVDLIKQNYPASSIYGGAKSDQVRIAIAEAWGWLVVHGFLAPHPTREGVTHFLTRRAHETSTSEEFDELRKASAIPWDMIHPDIRDHVRRDLLNGNYNGAVREAYIRVEVAVREAGKFDPGEIGVSLMRKAFKTDPPGPLTDQSAEDGEKDALGHFFAGALGFVKNPQSHRIVTGNKLDTALQAIMTASFLLNIVCAANFPGAHQRVG